MSCDYCSGKKPITLFENYRGREEGMVDLNIFKDFIKADYEPISTDSSFHARTKIFFCPMCGSSLKK